MKQIKINFWEIINVGCLAVVLSGCMSIPNSPRPRFYVLGDVSENQESKKINIVPDVAAIGRAERDGGEVPNPKPALIERSEGLAECRAQSARPVNSAMIIGVGPVKIPEYQNRPQIVTRDKEKMLNFSQFDRWGESLELGMARLLGEGLLVMLPEAQIVSYPWNSSVEVKYQVVVEVIQLDSELDKDLFLAAQWMVIDTQNSKTIIIKRAEFRHPVIPQNYSGLAKTISTACASLSSEIAESLELILKTQEDASVPKE